MSELANVGQLSARLYDVRSDNRHANLVQLGRSLIQLLNKPGSYSSHLCYGGNQPQSEQFQCLFDLSDMRAVVQVEQPSNDSLCDTKFTSQRNIAFIGLQHGVVQRDLGRGQGMEHYERCSAFYFRRRGDWLSIIDVRGEGNHQGVFRFIKRMILIVTKGNCFRHVDDSGDDLITIRDKFNWVSIFHLQFLYTELLADQLDVIVRKVLRAVHFDDGFATLESGNNVTAFPATDFDLNAFRSQFLQKLLPFHGQYIRTYVYDSQELDRINMYECRVAA